LCDASAVTNWPDRPEHGRRFVESENRRRRGKIEPQQTNQHAAQFFVLTAIADSQLRKACGPDPVGFPSVTVPSLAPRIAFSIDIL
jgi:hypothetical protein